MTIAYRSDTGKLVVDNFTGAQTISFVTQPVAGDLVVAGGAFYGGGTSFTPSVTDNQGNTYALDVSTDIVNGGSAPFASSNGAAIFSKENVANAGTLTLSFNTGGNSGSFIAVGGICFSGAVSSSALDVFAKANTFDTSKSSQDSGTTSITAQADSVAICALSVGNSGTLLTLTVSGYTVPIVEVDGTTHAVGGLAYKILTATGAQSATWTYGQASGSVNDDHGSVIAVYKGLGGGSPSNYAPAADIQVAGWTPTPDGSIFGTLDEDTAPSDVDYVTSPLLRSVAEECILTLDNSMPAGNYTVNIRAKSTSSTGNLRVRFLDAGGADVGATSIQGITTTLTTYSLSVTLTGTATQVQIEVTT